MRVFSSAVLGLCVALAACSAPSEAPANPQGGAHDGHDMSGDHMNMQVSEQEAVEKAAAAAMLVERFEVQACESVDLIGKVRKTGPNGREINSVRGFQASAECGEQLSAAIKDQGFTETEPGIFAGKAPEGASERLLIEVAEDASGASIEWEINAP